MKKSCCVFFKLLFFCKNMVLGKIVSKRRTILFNMSFFPDYQGSFKFWQEFFLFAGILAKRAMAFIRFYSRFRNKWLRLSICQIWTDAMVKAVGNAIPLDNSNLICVVQDVNCIGHQGLFAGFGWISFAGCTKKLTITTGIGTNFLAKVNKTFGVVRTLSYQRQQ